jgi:hypothetical protein
MAEQIILVCDECGRPAETSVTFRARGRSLALDLCAQHLNEIVSRAHAPRRGRRPAAVSGAGSTARDRATQAPAARRPRRKITDPAVLEKRRAALKKAREALARKRATVKKA